MLVFDDSSGTFGAANNIHENNKAFFRSLSRSRSVVSPKKKGGWLAGERLEGCGEEGKHRPLLSTQ